MMKKKYDFLSRRKGICLFLIFLLVFSVSACRLPGMPDKDPAKTLRTFYQEGKHAEAVNHYIKYKLIAETSAISYPGVKVRTLASQGDSRDYEDVKHTLYHIALSDQSSSEGYYPLLTLDLLSDGEWRIDPENTILAQQEDEVLAQVYYGENKFATFIYSIKEDTLTEIEPDSDLSAEQAKEIGLSTLDEMTGNESQ